jgi:hypothetical protein
MAMSASATMPLTPTFEEAVARKTQLTASIGQPDLDPEEKAAAIGLLLQIDKFLNTFSCYGGQRKLTSYSTYLKPTKVINKK